MLTLTPEGLYCSAGGFHIDPLQPVEKAVLTHAHADHARQGLAQVWASTPSVPLLRQRLGDEPRITGLEFGEEMRFGGVGVSLHPAGHMLGSAQVRVESHGEVWGVTGDFKRAPDPTCRLFEPVRCDALITEATFGLPLYRWPPEEEVEDELMEWIQDNRAQGKVSLALAYSAGKAQRLSAALAARFGAELGPIYAHGAVRNMAQAYAQAGVKLPEFRDPKEAGSHEALANGLVVAPPSVEGSAWVRSLEPLSSARVSGWMRLRGVRRRSGAERGFVLSDHADWDGLLATIQESGAKRIYVTHGKGAALVRYLNELGHEARPLEDLAHSEVGEESR